MSKDLVKTENNAGTAEILEKNENSFSFYNASLGRRVLSYLADLFISFILCVFMCEIVYFPIVKHSINYESKIECMKNAAESRYSLYYENEILYYEDAEKKYDFDSDFEYTSNIFAKFYVLKDIVGEENLIEDPIVHYYTEVAVESERKSYFDVALLYYGTSPENEYFEPYNGSVSKYLTLKQYWVERWAPFFDENDTVSEEIAAELKQFQAMTYKNQMLSVVNSFSKNSPFYEVLTDQINTIQDSLDMYYQITAFAAFFTVFIALFVVTPLVEKNGRTLGKIFLKLEIINNKNFKILKRKSRIAGIFLTLLEQLPIVLFIPFISVGITEIFSLPILLIVTIVSLVYVMISLFITIANKLNYSIKELLTSTVVIDRALLDQYYREVVYGEKRTTIE